MLNQFSFFCASSCILGVVSIFSIFNARAETIPHPNVHCKLNLTEIDPIDQKFRTLPVFTYRLGLESLQLPKQPNSPEEKWLRNFQVEGKLIPAFAPDDPSYNGNFVLRLTLTNGDSQSTLSVPLSPRQKEGVQTISLAVKQETLRATCSFYY
jgi:hypothetical protein